MRVVLLSGLGPMHIQSEDLSGTCMDLSLGLEDIEKKYSLGNLNFNPLKLEILIDNNKYKVLRKKNNNPPVLITSVLKKILDNNNISYSHVDLKSVWKGENIHLKADVVCLSTTFMWNTGMLDLAIDWINDNIVYENLIIGGQYSIIKKDYLLNNRKEIDYLVLGDAEESLPKLLEWISTNQKQVTIDEIPNLIYRKGEKVVQTFEEYKDIDCYERIKLEEGHDIISYISAKGCAHNCKFCALRVSNPKWRFHSADRVISDWTQYKEDNNVKKILVHDSTFFTPQKRLIEILEGIKELGIQWDSYARVDVPFSNQLIKQLEESNCNRLNFGFESMSNLVLGFMDKRTTAEQNRNVNKLLKESAIYTDVSFIVGFPGETPSEFKKTEKYLLNEHYGHFNLFIFELEDKSLPIWKEKEKYKIKIYEDVKGEYKWRHAGENWEHIGMTSAQAKELRDATIKKTRMSNSSAIHRTWQNRYEIPYVKQFDKKENLLIEKMLDQLVFLPLDYDDTSMMQKKGQQILEKLTRYNISIPK